MPEASSYTPPRLTPGRYKLVPTTDGDWLVLYQGNERLFPDRIFKRAQDAANALYALAAVDDMPYTTLYDRRTGVIRGQKGTF